MGDESIIPREEADVNIATASYSLENGVVALLVELAYEIEHFWTTHLDFRLKLLVLLLIWLTINVFLIKITWACYGDTFKHMFMKTGNFVIRSCFSI